MLYCERNANEVLHANWNSLLPVNVTDIARRLGYKVCQAALHESSVSHDYGSCKIILDASLPPISQRFALAHMIGRLTQDREADSAMRQDFFSAGVSPKAAWANNFAGYLLVPKEALQFMWRSFRRPTPALMARYFDVSDTLSMRRCKVVFGDSCIKI